MHLDSSYKKYTPCRVLSRIITINVPLMTKKHTIS